MSLPKLGIDVSKKTIEVALLRGDKVRHKSFANSTTGFGLLQSWLIDLGVSHVHAVMEATGSYGDALAEFLFDTGHQVSIVNPAQVLAFAQSELKRTKTDRVDAAVIARFARSHEPQPWNPPPKELRELQVLVRYRENLLDHRNQLSNRLTEGRLIPSVATSLETLIAAVDEEIKSVERQIREHIDQHPTLKTDVDLLKSITGIGDQTAVQLLAEIRQLHDYKSSRQVIAYVGLSPKNIMSGTSVRGRPRLSKIGNSRIRKALYWPAITALKHNPIVRALGERLAERGKHSLVIIGAAMRKLLTLAYGVLKSGKPFDENYAQSC
jgi:transposase